MHCGRHLFFTIQTRQSAESPYDAPDGPLTPVESKWTFACFNYFGNALSPWDKARYGYKLYPEASDQEHAVWARTSYHGWWSLYHAQNALERVRACDALGKYDYIDPGSRRKTQVVRHEFRIVRVELEFKVEAVQEAERATKQVA